MKVIGWELTQNNNIICIFLRKIKLFQLNKYDQYLVSVCVFIYSRIIKTLRIEIFIRFGRGRQFCLKHIQQFILDLY